MPSKTETKAIDWDPEFLQSRRELVVILLAFTISLIWSIVIAYVAGYPTQVNRSVEVMLVWGMPRWVFWGILAPWIVIDCFVIWFCFAYMRDGSDELDPSFSSDTLPQAIPPSRMDEGDHA